MTRHNLPTISLPPRGTVIHRLSSRVALVSPRSGGDVSLWGDALGIFVR